MISNEIEELSKTLLVQIDRNKIKRCRPYIAIQVGAVSFVNKGIERVLDIFREKGAC